MKAQFGGSKGLDFSQFRSQMTQQARPVRGPITGQVGLDPTQTTPMPVICPPIMPQPPEVPELAPEQLTAIQGVGGAGTRGTGTISGLIDVQRMGQQLRPFLVTANPGTRSEVKFLLDIDVADAQARRGARLDVTGTIDKATDYSGRIQGAQLSETKGIGVGAYRTFGGRVETLHLMGIGGEAPPSGKYLMLDTYITVAGKTYDRLFLGHQGEDIADGAQVDLHGRVDVVGYGGVEVRDGTVLKLSGISNASAGEPGYTERDGFTTQAGKPAPMLILERRDILDAPNLILVPDQGADTAFVGTHGGMRMRGTNPFGGFDGSAAIEFATEADRAKIKFDEQSGKLMNTESGEALTLVSQRSFPEQGADQMATSWYFDKGANTAYRFQNGGIAGFINHMDQVVRLP